jgi:hypothetical protein
VKTQRLTAGFTPTNQSRKNKQKRRNNIMGLFALIRKVNDHTQQLKDYDSELENVLDRLDELEENVYPEEDPEAEDSSKEEKVDEAEDEDGEEKEPILED